MVQSNFLCCFTSGNNKSKGAEYTSLFKKSVVKIFVVQQFKSPILRVYLDIEF